MVTRDHAGRWLRGAASPNPSGVSRDIVPLVAEARRLALSYAPKAVETLAKLLDSEDERVRVAAAEGLLDRAGLRPYSLEPERLEVTAVPVDVDELRAQLAARVASLVQATASTPPAARALVEVSAPSDGGQK